MLSKKKKYLQNTKKIIFWKNKFFKLQDLQFFFFFVQHY